MGHWWLLGVAVPACGGGAPERTAGGNMRDSAGIHIVTYDAPPSAIAFTVSAQPLYVHGGNPDDYAFREVFDAALQPDGGAVVADLGNNEVVLLGPDGALRSILAKPGPGPSEVGRVMSVTVLGQDTILVEDDGNGRLTTFAGGAIAGSISTAGNFALTGGLRVLAVDDRGAALMGTSAFQPDFTTPWLAGHLVRFDPTARAADTVGTYEMVPALPRQGAMNPFTPIGRLVASVRGFVSGRSDRAELLWRDPSGTPRQIVRWHAEPTYPTDRDWDAWRARMRTQLALRNPQRTGPALDELVARQVQRYRMAPDEPLPLWSELVDDAEGRLWLAAFAPGGASVGTGRYDVIGADGTWLGTVALPPRFRVLDAGYGRVLGVLTDTLDVESVVAYRLSATAGSH